VMMYRAFTGRLPFTADSTIGILARQLTESPQPPSELAPVEPDVEGLILHCMAKHRDARVQTMGEVASRLRNLPRALVGYASLPRLVDSGTWTNVAFAGDAQDASRNPSAAPEANATKSGVRGSDPVRVSAAGALPPAAFAAADAAETVRGLAANHRLAPPRRAALIAVACAVGAITLGGAALFRRGVALRSPLGASRMPSTHPATAAAAGARLPSPSVLPTREAPSSSTASLSPSGAPLAEPSASAAADDSAPRMAAGAATSAGGPASRAAVTTARPAPAPPPAWRYPAWDVQRVFR